MANATKTILIIEDSEDWRQLVTMVIKRWGYEVIEAATGLDGIYQASAAHPDLILMDLGLPGMSGDEAIAHLKTHPSTRDIPVIVQTAYSIGVMTNRAIEAGAKEILHKPIELVELQLILRRYLSAENETQEPIAAIG
jgi:CheY-like chemotaxis protein